MTVMLLHDLGDPAGGAQWRAVAPRDWVIPDLPGHGTTPALRTGHCDPMSVVTLARWTVAAESDATLVGVGQNAHGALVNAAGDACRRVVIVDGLWGQWRNAREEIDAFYAMIRAIAADEAAISPAPPAGLDPRTKYGYGIMASAAFAQRFWGAIDQPVLVIETPRSQTPAAERAERLSWFGGETTLAELDSDDPRGIVATIIDWL